MDRIYLKNYEAYWETPWIQGLMQGLQRRLTARIGTAMYWAPEVPKEKFHELAVWDEVITYLNALTSFSYSVYMLTTYFLNYNLRPFDAF